MAKKGCTDDLKSLLGSDDTVVRGADETQLGDVLGLLDTGSYLLNAAVSADIYGGIPSNLITLIGGDPATGKTYFILSAVKSFLQLHQDVPSHAVIFDTEGAHRKDMYTDRNLDRSRATIVTVKSLESLIHKMLKTIAYAKENNIKMFMAVDSIGNISTDKEIQDLDKEEDKRDMTKAPGVRKLFRNAVVPAVTAGIPIIVAAHVYDVIGSYVPEKRIGGGKGAEYAATTVLMLSKKRDRDETTKEILGDLIKVKIMKSRLTKPYTEIEVRLRHDGGIHRYYGLEELAVKTGIFTEVRGGYELDGVKISARQIESDPKSVFTPELLERINAAAAKEYSYRSDDTATDLPKIEEIEDEPITRTDEGNPKKRRGGRDKKLSRNLRTTR